MSEPDNERYEYPRNAFNLNLYSLTNAIMSNGAKKLKARAGEKQSDYAYRVLKERILESELSPGQRLVEARLAKELNLSRTPVREALARLRAENLIERDEHGALVVSAPTPRDVDDTYQIREALDGLAARLAAERISGTELKVAEATVDRFHRHTDVDVDDTRQMIGANLDFHDLLYQATDNPRLIQMATEIRDFVRLVSRNAISLPERQDEIAREHQAVIEAIRARDGDLAERLMREHVNNAREATIKGLTEGLAEWP